MLILKILDLEYHVAKRSESESKKIPVVNIVNDYIGFTPVLVSNTKGSFIVRRKVFQNAHPCGIFPYNSDKLDDVLRVMFDSSFELSTLEKWDNIFESPSKAFSYIQEESGLKTQPHICLVPDSWSDNKLFKFFGKTNLDISVDMITYNKVCSIRKCSVSLPVFLSKPDNVGLLTQFPNNLSSILLHNVRKGMAFCKDVSRKTN